MVPILNGVIFFSKQNVIKKKKNKKGIITFLRVSVILQKRPKVWRKKYLQLQVNVSRWYLNWTYFVRISGVFNSVGCANMK